MAEMTPLFGYHKADSLSSLLFSDGTFVIRTTASDAIFNVSEDCVNQVREIISLNEDNLYRYVTRINDHRTDLANENYFIFNDLKIIDWDLARWFLEEDREGHPDYYKNALKVGMTKSFVRSVFDEICAVIEQDEKSVRYMRTFYNSDNGYQ